MAGILYPPTPGALWALLVVVAGLGGLAAWSTGRALAKTWRPWELIPIAMIPLTAAARFLQFISVKTDLLSPHYFAVAFVVLATFAALGYRRTRARQMVTQYGFAFAAAGPLAWRRRIPAGAAPASGGLLDRQT